MRLHAKRDFNDTAWQRSPLEQLEASLSNFVWVEAPARMASIELR